MDPLEDPDYTLIVRAQDLGGASETALSGNTRVHIVMQENLWVNPGPLNVKEHLQDTYPMLIAKVWWTAHSNSAPISQMQTHQSTISTISTNWPLHTGLFPPFFDLGPI